MTELYPGYDMAVAVAAAIGWTADMEDGKVRAWNTPTGYLMAGAFDPEHNDGDAFDALDAWLAKHDGMTYTMFGSVMEHGIELRNEAAVQLCVVSEMATRPEAICHAILAAKKREAT